MGNVLHSFEQPTGVPWQRWRIWRLYSQIWASSKEIECKKVSEIRRFWHCAFGPGMLLCMWSALSKMAVGEMRWIINAFISGITYIYTYIYIYLSCILLIKPVELWPATNTMDSLRNDDQTFDLDVVSLPWGKILGCRAAAAVTVAGPFWSLEIWTTKSDSLLLHWSNKVNLQVQITRLSSIETDYVSTTSVSVLPFQIGVDATEGTEGLAPKPSHWSTLWLQIENHWHEPRANIGFQASFDEKWWKYNQKASLEMTFYFRNMQWFEKQDNKLSVFSTWSFFRQMLRLVVWIEWSRSFHLPSQPLQCPATHRFKQKQLCNTGASF